MKVEMDLNDRIPIWTDFRKFFTDRRGITGLETAIVLIAFVVVAAVFAFTVLTTGLFTSEKAKETTMAGVASSSSTLALKGTITAIGGSGAQGAPVVDCAPPAVPCTFVQYIRVKITSASSAQDVAFDPRNVLVTYRDDQDVILVNWFDPDGGIVDWIRLDANQAADINSCRTGQIGLMGLPAQTPHRWCTSWPVSNDGTNPDDSLEPGEVTELYIFLHELNSRLGTDSRFSLEIIPQQGSPLTFQRTTPLSLAPVMALD